MSEQACEHCGVYPGFRHWSDCPLHGPADGKPYEPTRTPSPAVSDEVVETVARAIERAWSRNHASIRSNPDIAWKVWTPEAEAAIEASGYAAIKADNERMKELIVGWWHEDFLPGELHEALGMTWEEYQKWANPDARTILQEVSR